MTTGTHVTAEERAEERPAGIRGLFVADSPKRLVALSALTLFLELALIRWTAANNVHLAIITNFVLLASFLGIGLGYLLARSRRDLFRLVPLALAVLVAFELAAPVKLVTLKGTHEFQGLPQHGPVSQWVSLPLTFVLVVLVMTGLAQATARTFACFKPLDAYRFDIIGSIGGIVLFSALSFVGLPPIAWGAVVASGLVLLFGVRQRWWQWGLTAALVAMLLAESLSSVDVWSPYYKITMTRSVTVVPGVGRYSGLSISANNIPYQTLYSVSTLRHIEPFYFFPYRHVTRSSLRDVLIIGAGTGNDVSVALAEGARHVDAVEIDPDLVAIGRAHNPSHAYESSRVKVYVDDGRAFLQDTTKRYSLILYALPDSLTALGGQSAPVGLENYLLTTQAIDQAREHLARGGTFAMYNYYQPFLLDRYATALDEVFRSSPCVELGNTLAGRQQAVLTVAGSGRTANCSSFWHGRRVAPVTDDRPFPYLPTPSIPGYYLLVMGLILAVSLISVRVSGGPLKKMAAFVDLFFMGAAFMLLESKNVVQFALLFGTTWFVNSLVFAGVLLAVYCAVEVARHLRLPHPVVLYGALVAALAVAYVVPQDSLLGLQVVLRFFAATALAFAPVFLANLVFAQRFKDVSASTTAFGSNLLGAIVGGVLEYLSLITGFRLLLVLVAVLYALAFAFGRRNVAAVS
ncbi:MAG: spermidine synthase [Acidimicrobiales bacterium]